MKERLLVYRDQCRHFTGIQHKTCAVGVAYNDVRDASQPGPYRWPCLESSWGHIDASLRRATTTCDRLSLLTQEEHRAKDEELRAAVDKALAAVESGVCHICGAPAEPSVIVGRCRYAACGHRVGQVLVEEAE
jgi:hypothetical protein